MVQIYLNMTPAKITRLVKQINKKSREYWGEENPFEPTTFDDMLEAITVYCNTMISGKWGRDGQPDSFEEFLTSYFLEC